MDIQLFLCQTCSCQCVCDLEWSGTITKQGATYSITRLPVAIEIQASILKDQQIMVVRIGKAKSVNYVCRASVFFLLYLYSVLLWPNGQMVINSKHLVCSTLIVIKDVHEICMITIPTINIANDTHMYVMYPPHHATDNTYSLCTKNVIQSTLPKLNLLGLKKIGLT